jgi:hypothetical protein
MGWLAIKIILMLAVLFIGWFISRLIQTIIVRFLKAIQFDIASEKSGFTPILQRGGIKRTPAELIGFLVYCGLMLIVLVFMINLCVAGTGAEVPLVKNIANYIPNVIGAIFIIVIGMFIANFIAGVVQTAVAGAGKINATILGNITRYSIIIFALVLALDQLKVAPSILPWAFGLPFGALCLAVGLAFGLGCRDYARDLMADLLKSAKEKEE